MMKISNVTPESKSPKRQAQWQQIEQPSGKVQSQLHAADRTRLTETDLHHPLADR
jgi:hypothetical protein